MGEITKAALLFSLVGVLYIGLGIPLLRGRVPPNSWYGCRTRKTLSDENVWYAVNRVTGRDIIIAGIMLIGSSFVVSVFGRDEPGLCRADPAFGISAIGNQDGR